MKEIDEARLESDAGYRFEYLAEFMGFTADDIAAIHGAAPLLGPLVPGLVDAVYDKLRTYTSTWRHFTARQEGYDADVPTSIGDLAIDDPVIKFRKQHLGRYFTALVTRPYDDKFVHYIDMIGKMHTSGAGSSEVSVPLVQMNALLGFVADALNATILGADIPQDTKFATLRAFSKLLWLQSDFISRHYVT